MAYDVTALIQDIKTRAKDPDLPDSLITTWLQETQDGVLGHYRLSKLETSVAPTLSIGALTYSYPDELQTILGVKLKDGINVFKPHLISYEEFDSLYPNPEDMVRNAPVNAADYGRTLYWDRPLLKAYVLTLKYLRRPVQLTSGAIVPDIPIEFRELMLRGGLQRAEEFRENFDIAALHERKVESLTEDMILRYNMRQLVTPHRATTNGRRVGMLRRRR